MMRFPVNALSLPILTAALALAAAASSQSGGPADSPRKPPAARAVLDSAVKSAKNEKKTVFLHFSASW